jgi:hypothetical protein
MIRPNITRRAPSGDRSIRSLVSLQSSASTCRTLNLVAAWQRHREESAYKNNPFFHNPVLNRCFVVKHRLRPNERDLFDDDRSNATKIILPLDIRDLRSGARSFFIGQRGYWEVLEDLLGPLESNAHPDIDLLDLLDTLPSLDPFLMRERLKKAGFAPARCYFDIADADSAKMFEFVRKEITPLIGMSFQGADSAIKDKAAKLAQKILADANDADLEPLRMGMGLDKASFDEGIFCWKGFIYYKWVMGELAPRVRPIMMDVMTIKPNGHANPEEREIIGGCKSRLVKGISTACDTVLATLKIYDDAYSGLTKNSDPRSFRDFLMMAPSLFYELGERLAAVEHVVSFWRFRFPPGQASKPTPDELVDILMDFEASLAFEPLDQAA